ncbi:MAG TPA: succinate dehydrogenase cytochrome b subunit [Kouleothrix sp.]|uniref:succinate dehydrogenase cytochrome b subunit n=1 Tax=Kouleothrix sp. TaxID=2779161 RepID=UPI002BF90D30|nr:succinate dehydrogenase cytochrome b subunit [Kouleothrix sp.]HRC74635.1 succinate dehydrogenase cytochrome b subunit [Kouleothrix sp.]
MAAALTLYRSSIGKKAIMAVSGLIGVGFLVVHMYGNLKIFLGPEYFNEYAAGLRTLGGPIFGHTHLLWIARVVLLAAVAAHIWSAYELTRQDLGGRPRANRYGQKKSIAATYAARTMRWGGVILFLFIVFHLMHFTLGLVGYSAGQFQAESNGQFHAYENVIAGFSFWPATLFYIVAMLCLGMHLYHGFWSAFQTLGLNSYKTNFALRGLALLVALALTVGFVAVPIAVLFGIVR